MPNSPSRSPFILIPAAPSASFPAASQAIAKSAPTLAFKPPAHVHAHQIHSIPPSSTSTRSLIIEKILAHLTDVRLAAERAHLGFGAITIQPGPESVRHRHEFYKGYTYSHSPSAVEKNKESFDKLDSDAKGISSTVCAMLAQEPAQGASSRSHQQLPNDVRFRLVLAILLEHYFLPSPPEPSSSKDKMPEIPLDLAPFVSLSSYRASPPSSSTSRPSHHSLPPLKSLDLSSSKSTRSLFASFSSFSAPGVSSSSVKPPKPFLSASPSGTSATPAIPRPTLSPVLANSGSEKETPVPVFKWPSQERNASSSSGPSEISRTTTLPKTMTNNFNWLTPTPSVDKEKSLAALWDRGLTEISASYCTRHLRNSCGPCKLPSLSRSQRSTIGAGLDSRRSRLGFFSDLTAAEERRARMLNVLSEFIRISALISPTSASQPRKDWYSLLALILTRTVLEGYILQGWRGTRAAQVLFGFGGQNAKRVSPKPVTTFAEDSDSESDASDEEDDETEFSPDGYLNLEGAYTKLFSPSATSTPTSLEELRTFREEMNRRRTEFLSPAEIPSGGLVAHLNSLNEKYSAEELDKKMILFVERVSRWKGIPALGRNDSGKDSLGSKKLDAYFHYEPSTTKADTDRDESSSEEESLQPEADISDEEPSSEHVVSTSSKRPRAPSLTDSPPSPTSSAPPLKKERLGLTT